MKLRDRRVEDVRCVEQFLHQMYQENSTVEDSMDINSWLTEVDIYGK